MRCSEENMVLYAVTDRAWTGRESLYDQVEKALKGGVTCVQLREKNLDEETFLKEAEEIGDLCRRYGVPFIVNDSVTVAIACRADGVHVGQQDMEAKDVRRLVGEDMIIGVSVHSVEEAKKAVAQGADYLGVGAVFSTSTKTDVDQMPMEILQNICRAVDIPVVAIGGIHQDNIMKLAGSGVDGVALVSAIFSAQNIEETCRKLKSMSKEMVEADCGRDSEGQAFCGNLSGKRLKAVLSIAGTDPTGGAGIQADLKAMTLNGVFAMSAVTALVAQNTTGVRGIMQVEPEFLGQQIDAVFEDIFPDAVKIGMVFSGSLIHVIADRLRFYKARNVVLDPVMVAASGGRLINEEAVDALKKELMPLAAVATPNIPEAEVLSGMSIHDSKDMETAAGIISETYGCRVLLKGGHSINDANDLFYENGRVKWFMGKRIDNPNTHGTGCTLSSAIAANLAKGYDLDSSIRRAKEYLTGALAAMLDLGRGSGPMNHGFYLQGEYIKEAEQCQP